MWLRALLILLHLGGVCQDRGPFFLGHSAPSLGHSSLWDPMSCSPVTCCSSQVVQKLVLSFGRLNYLPLEKQFMPCLEQVLVWEAGVAPLAIVNILMSLCQLRCLPFRALHFIFSLGFINYISGRQCLAVWRGPRSQGWGVQSLVAQCVPSSCLPTVTPHAPIV